MGRPRKFTHTSLSKVVRLQLAIRISRPTGSRRVLPPRSVKPKEAENPFLETLRETGAPVSG